MGTQTGSIEVTITGAAGQNKRCAKIPAGMQANEVVDQLLPSMGLPKHDPENRPLVYRLSNARTGRQLSGGDVVSDTVLENDTLRVLPDITPG